MKNDKVLEILIGLLDDHPENNRIFGIDKDELEPLTVSIRAMGVLQPLLVEKKENGRYTILSGHRRKYASIEAGLIKVPCIMIKEDIDADLALTETNLTFRIMSPMKKARAIRFEIDTLGIKHGGDRKSTDRKSSHNRCILIEKFNMSRNSLYLYDKLNELIPPIQAMVDCGSVTISLGAKLGGLSPDVQKELFEYLGDDIKNIGPEEVLNLKKQNDRGYLVLEVMQKRLEELEVELKERNRKDGEIAILEKRIQVLQGKKRTLEYDLSDYANAAVRSREKIMNNGAALLNVVEGLIHPISGAKPKIDALLETTLEPATATHLVKWSHVLIEVGVYGTLKIGQPAH